MPSRRSIRVVLTWAVLALVGAVLQIVSFLHTCDRDVIPPYRATAAVACTVEDRADAADDDCAACVLSSHTRTAFTTGDAAVLPPVPDGLVQPFAHANWTANRVQDLSARSPPLVG